MNSVQKLNQERYQKISEAQKKVHAVFARTDAGKELLEEWVEAFLIITNGNSRGEDAYNLGFVEGQKQFVRKIMLDIKQAEGK